jgi:hypothetical protein
LHSEDDEIYIDGVKMPTLKLNGLTYKKEKIWSKNTGRVSNGTMKGDVVARKYTLSCQWPPLTRAQTALIDKAIDPAFINVEFRDPGTNNKVVKRFYAGTPTYPVYSYVKGVKTYAGVAVDLIQQ